MDDERPRNTQRLAGVIARSERLVEPAILPGPSPELPMTICGS
jgi:hypothetical protein